MDSKTRRDIDNRVARLLREVGVTAPPVRVDDLLAHLRVHRDFYNLEDPGLLQRFAHHLRIGAIRGGALVTGVLTRIKLSALWRPDERRITIHSELPAPKQKWAEFHETTHSLLPWHREFFLGDTAQTLDPEFQEQLEAEANYGASAMMFVGDLFTSEALATSPDWQSVELLAKRYGASKASTLRRYVEHGHSLAMAMMVSTPAWMPKPADQDTRCRHFVASGSFAETFGRAGSQDFILRAIDSHARARKGGPVADFTFGLADLNNVVHEVRAESFFNRHYLMTLLVDRGPRAVHVLRPLAQG